MSSHCFCRTTDALQMTMSQEGYTYSRVEQLLLLECADAFCSSQCWGVPCFEQKIKCCELVRHHARHLFRTRSAGSHLRSGVCRSIWRAVELHACPHLSTTLGQCTQPARRHSTSVPSTCAAFISMTPFVEAMLSEGSPVDDRLAISPSAPFGFFRSTLGVR